MVNDNDVIRATRDWVARVVVGLNLCPFAGPVLRDGLAIVVSHAKDDDTLVAELQRELEVLAETDAARAATTLLVIADWLDDFDDYNQFLDVADGLLQALSLDGVIQVASFHPDYRFAGVAADDISHFSNRSPYPMLHLLREVDVAAAVAAHPDADGIPARNVARLQALSVTQRRESLRLECRALTATRTD